MGITVLDNIRIVLVEPAGPLNIGAIARVMKNMGLGHLVLVNPHCDHLGPEARQMAVHAGDLLVAAAVAPTVAAGLAECHWAIATTGRPRTLATTLESPRSVMPWLIEVAQQGQVALIFGPEDRGLNNDELNYAQRFISIPANPIYPSLNLAQAVGVCCYELYQCVLMQSGESGNCAQEPVHRNQATGVTAIAGREPPLLPAPLAVMEAYYQHLEGLLLRIGYLYPHTAHSRMQKFRRLFSRALPSSEEVALLRGVLSQVEWAVQNSTKNSSKK